MSPVFIKKTRNLSKLLQFCSEVMTTIKKITIDICQYLKKVLYSSNRNFGKFQNILIYSEIIKLEKKYILIIEKLIIFLSNSIELIH